MQERSLGSEEGNEPIANSPQHDDRRKGVHYFFFATKKGAPVFSVLFECDINQPLNRSINLSTNQPIDQSP